MKPEAMLPLEVFHLPVNFIHFSPIQIFGEKHIICGEKKEKSDTQLTMAGMGKAEPGTHTIYSSDSVAI